MKWIALLLFGTIGAATLIGGLYWASTRYTLMQHGTLTQGRVVGQQEQVSTSNEGRHLGYNETTTSYYPIVEFAIANGEKMRVVGTTGGGEGAMLETGAEVNVIYDPADPSDALIADFQQAWLGPLVLSGVGAVFLLFGIAGFVLIGKSDRQFQALGEVMRRDALTLRADSLRIEAKVDRIERVAAEGSPKYVLVCKGLRPGQRFEEQFRSEHFPFAPDREILGRKVDVYLDPTDPSVYRVELGPLLREVMKARR